MQGLSIRQPWPWAITHAGKNVENRSWHTNMRGTFAIVSSLKKDAASFACMRELVPNIQAPAKEDLAFGCVIGTARLVDCLPSDHPTLAGNKWVEGPYCFVLEDVRLLKTPVPCSGRLGFFELPPAVVKELVKQCGPSITSGGLRSTSPRVVPEHGLER